MPGPDTPDTPPPEVPEEFAAAYSEAYRRALESGEYDELDPAFVPVDPAYAGQAAASVAEVEPQEVVSVGSHRPDGITTGPLERARSSRLFVPVLLLAGALVLILSAYGLGRVLADDGTPSAGSPSPVSPLTSIAPSRDASRTPSPTQTASAGENAYDGSVAPVVAGDPEATCTARPSVDSSGKTVRYEAANTLDSDAATAWRCDGSAIGEKLTFSLPEGTELAEVGLIPGYAKTDPKSGADRYVENNRITRVRWTLGDGVTIVQNFDPDPENRAVQALRVPKTETDEVTLEILEVRRGPRDTTAISEVSFAAAD